jgi:hypothetical protein
VPGCGYKATGVRAQTPQKLLTRAHGDAEERKVIDRPYEGDEEVRRCLHNRTLVQSPHRDSGHFLQAWQAQPDSGGKLIERVNGSEGGRGDWRCLVPGCGYYGRSVMDSAAESHYRKMHKSSGDQRLVQKPPDDGAEQRMRSKQKYEQNKQVSDQ